MKELILAQRRMRGNTDIDIAQLETLVKDLDAGQRNIELAARIEKSPPIMKRVHGFWGRARSYLTGQPLQDLFGMFEQQQTTVRELNVVTAGLVIQYTYELERARTDLDTLIDYAAEQQQKSQEASRKAVPAKVELDKARHQIKSVGEGTQPYYKALHHFVDARRRYSKVSLDKNVTSYASSYHNREMENLFLHETIFETILQRVASMAHATGLYQRTLDTNLPRWKATQSIAQVVTALDKGVRTLSSYNQMLQDNYCSAAESISSIIDQHPELLDNRRLRQVADVLCHEDYTRRDTSEA